MLTQGNARMPQVDPAVLEQFSASQMTDAVPLMVPRKDNGFMGVTLCVVRSALVLGVFRLLLVRCQPPPRPTGPWTVRQLGSPQT